MPPMRMSLVTPNSRDAEAVKKNAFHDQKILVVNIDDDRIGWVEREVLKQVGEKLFGKLPAGG